MTRVVLVDDHTLVRQSVHAAVSASPGLEVVGDTGRGDEAVELIARRRPEVAVLDINLPGKDGFEVLQEGRQAVPTLRVVFLTMHEDDGHIRRAVQLGADGYLPKTASTSEVVDAIVAVGAGGSYLSPSVARRVMSFAARRVGPSSDLTDRENEILELLAAGEGVKEIAGHVFLSVKTVKNHMTSVYAKLGVRSAAQAVAEAYRRGLVAGPGQ